jgi:hypothetical protein
MLKLLLTSERLAPRTSVCTHHTITIMIQFPIAAFCFATQITFSAVSLMTRYFHTTFRLAPQAYTIIVSCAESLMLVWFHADAGIF